MRCAQWLLALLFLYTPTFLHAQSTLPTPEQVWIVGGRSARQATTQAPLELTLPSGVRVTIPAQDIHQHATNWARAELLKQASPPIDPVLLFVLRVREVASAGKTHTDVTLSSGAVVRVAASDMGDFRLMFLRTALAQAVAVQQAGPAERRGGSTAGTGSSDTAPPSPAEAVPIIREKCAKEWPDDFSMRAYCQKQQDGSLEALRLRAMTGSPDHRTIRAKCARDWPDDFMMRDYCEKQQLEALRLLR